jgi:hypothetical protein
MLASKVVFCDNFLLIFAVRKFLGLDENYQGRLVVQDLKLNEAAEYVQSIVREHSKKSDNFKNVDTLDEVLLPQGGNNHVFKTKLKFLGIQNLSQLLINLGFSDGGNPLFARCCQDITEQRKQEAERDALQLVVENHKLISGLCENSPVAMVKHDSFR